MTNIFPMKADVAIIKTDILKYEWAKIFSQLVMESNLGVGVHAIIFAGIMQHRYMRVETLITNINKSDGQIKIKKNFIQHQLQITIRKGLILWDN